VSGAEARVHFPGLDLTAAESAALSVAVNAARQWHTWATP
jgi:hypothetical protein